MSASSKNLVFIADNIARALSEKRPVVLLESTVISHGLPYPENLETALACEATVRSGGAEPATVGVVRGIPTVGLNEHELKQFANSGDIDKVSLSNLPVAMARKRWAATTVAATLKVADMAELGYRGTLRPVVFATGGIGGVHRGAAESGDVSADLTALARFPIFCVCAGVKAVLDLAKTLEYLETTGVPVIGYRAAEFPAFYSRNSGLPVDASVESPQEAVEIAAGHWRGGATTAVLVCAAIPEKFEIPANEMRPLIDLALDEAARQGIRGKAVTPFLLERLKLITGGRTLDANRALLLNNASMAAEIAVAISRR